MEPVSIHAFIAQVDSSAGPEACWPWRGGLDHDGYARFGKGGSLAHRTAFELMKQPVPAGLVIDHTCHNDSSCTGGRHCPHRRCVNPLHLRAVRQAVNVRASRNTRAAQNAAKTHCPRRHEYTPENTRHSIGKYGPRRDCRTCIRERSRKRRVTA